MAEKIVCILDSDGYLIGTTIADESPLEAGIYMIPAGAVDFPPPVLAAGKRAKFNGNGFDIENIPPAPVEPAPVPPTQEEISSAVAGARQAAYWQESDPLFFKAQRGEAAMEEWLAKVAEIKARFPDGVMPS